MTILDTNVISEGFKPSPSARVVRWLSSQAPESVFVTTLTVAEVLYGIEILPAGKRRAGLAKAAERVFTAEFANRVLAFDADAARLFAKIVAGRKSAGHPIAQFDAMIAAIARSRSAIIATRNVADFEGCGIRVVDPWTE